MSLEDASNGTYLETTYEVADGKDLSYRLKNANETDSKIWMEVSIGINQSPLQEQA